MRCVLPLLLAAVLLSVSCAKKGARTESNSSQESFTVSLQVEALGSADVVPQTIPSGEVLHSGDRFALQVLVDRPLHVSVILYSHTGWSTQLYPRGADPMLRSGQPLHLPAPGDYFRLDEKPGREEIYVVAGPRPLDEATCAHLRLPCRKAPPTEQVRGDDEPPPPPPPPPPDGVPDSERPAELLRDGTRHTLRQRSPITDQTLLKFSIEHRP